MLIEVKIPSVGESVTEAILAEWYKQDGEVVRKDDPLFVIETDKVTLEVVAEASGILEITVAEGETVPIGTVVGTIDTEGAPAEAESAAAAAPKAPEPEAPPPPEVPAAAPAPEPIPAHAGAPAPEPSPPVATEGDLVLPPAVRRLVAEKGIDIRRISGTGPGGRITKGDVMLFIEQTGAAPTAEAATLPAPVQATQEAPTEDAVVRKPMTPIRQRIAARLLEAKQNTAMLTTFNEIDMSRVMAVRASYKEAFQKKYGISLGFMSFFLKATVEALKESPAINAYIEGKEIVYHNYYNIGVAIGSGRGLVVPVIRNSENLSFAGLEQAIVDYVEKIKDNRLELSDLEGGTFTISNGGVYGSLLSTPILNTPQSGILGMHKIEKRPIVVDDEIVIRPMMYVALSYDHRIVDGKEAVTCLRRMKEFLEDPERMLLEI